MIPLEGERSDLVEGEVWVVRTRDEGPVGWAPPGGSVALPCCRALDRLGAVLDELADLSPGVLADGEVAAALDRLTRLQSRATSARLRLVAEADRRRLGDATGARSTAHWWAARSRLTRGEAGRLVRVARLLDADAHAPVAGALRHGDLLLDQAQVILDAVEAIPAEVADASVRTRAQEVLLDDASRHDARGLRVLGRRILDVVAPEIGEAHEQRLLEADERAASATARFTMVDDGHGRCHGRFTLPATHGEMLRKALTAIASPRRPGAPTDPTRPEQVPLPDRMGHALMEYVERYPADRLPDAGGVNASVVVTISLDALTSGLGTAALDTGALISAGEARRLACEAGLIPAVLGGACQPLDLGRTRRLHSQSQWIALGLRDRGCTTAGCDMPPGGCHAHHDQPWSRGGPTSVDGGRLLCPRHHRLAHDSRYAMTHLPGGKVAFTMRR